jgi:hypothetical protein
MDSYTARATLGAMRPEPLGPEGPKDESLESSENLPSRR